MVRTRKGEGIVKQVFGGSLYQQGRGFYVSLELLAILRGSLLHEQAVNDEADWILPPENRSVLMWRPTHDFARRLMSGPRHEVDALGSEHLVGEDTVSTLRSLLLGLQAPVPGRRSDPSDWRKWHLYPYPPDFIHYDALQRRGRINIERDSYRGGGGLAHKILRSDPDAQRLTRTRDAVRQLLADSDSPLGALGRALHQLDSSHERSHDAWEDNLEMESVAKDSPWLEILRAGFHTLVTREDITASKTLEAILHWVPFCIMRHQQSLAFARLNDHRGKAPIATVFDSQPLNNPIRDRARQDFQRSNAAVLQALETTARESEAIELLQGTKNWMKGPRTFFATTAFSVGAANAASGIRWFTIQPQLLETIVLARVYRPCRFDDFCRRTLYQELGMIVGKRAAQKENVTSIDQSVFDRNTESIAELLADLGLLERFSDATRMVGVPR